jgi:hypothetical protein
MKQTMLFLMILAIMPAVVSAYNLDILETNPSPVNPGEYADITVRVISTRDVDEISNDVEVFVEETDDIRPLAGQSYSFTQLRGGDQITKTFRIFFSEKLSAGNVPVTFNVRDNGAIFKFEEDIFLRGGIKTPELVIGDIDTVPRELLKDTTNNKITITLQNLGDETAELLVAEMIDLDCCIEQSFTYSLRDSISSLEGGQEATLEYTFDVLETAKDIITPSLNVRYRTLDELTNSYQTVTESIPFEIPVTKAPDIEITKVTPVKNIESRSQENEVLIHVTNAGEEEGESIRLRIYPDPSYPFDFERTNYLISSKLNPGENASVKIKFDVLDFATLRSYPIAVELESIVGENRYVQDGDINIEVTGEGTNQALIFRYVFLIVAVVIAIILGSLTIFGNVKKKGQ